MALEISLEKRLKTYTESLGGKCIKLGFLIGIPDRMLLLPYATVIIVETKTPLGDLSPMQCRWLDFLNGLGFQAYCGKDYDSIKSLIDATIAYNKERWPHEAP